MSNDLHVRSIEHDYLNANSRLIVLDYDGTLVPFELHPQLATPPQSTKSLIRSLVSDSKNSTILISGRDKENLDAYWGDVNLVLAAEHGGYFKPFGGAWHKMFSTPVDWMPKAKAALLALSFQFEGSFVEEKTFSVAWHYRAVKTKVTDSEKGQILAALRALNDMGHFIICDSDFTLELRTPGIDKGSFVARWVGGRNYDFIMAIGDSQTDEDLFNILGRDAYSVKVRKTINSSANYHLHNHEDVLNLLQELINAQDRLVNRNHSLTA